MHGEVVGRASELDDVSAFLASLEGGPGSLIIEGEPGIGKTTVWRESVARAKARSMTVLSTRPSEYEVPLGFNGLADLFGPVADSVLGQLPSPQRRALAIALLHEEPGGAAIDRRAVAAATLGGLTALARRQPVVVAIDDLHWLDPASANALAFAIRRFTDQSVGILGCLRSANATAWLTDAMAEGPLHRVSLAPLSLGALRSILVERLGASFNRPTLVRIHRASRGNPFYALELARASVGPTSIGDGDETTPENLLALVEDRVGGLPQATRDVLVATAAQPSPSLASIAAATGLSVTRARAALHVAATAGIVRFEASTVRFEHPILATVLYSSAPPDTRRTFHRRLARTVSDHEERARHAALGADRPDAGVADLVERAAESALRRGAPEEAAQLAEYARSLTPPIDRADRVRRTIVVAEYKLHAGELDRAMSLLDALLAAEPEGMFRADALRLRGEIQYHQTSYGAAVASFEEALEHAGDDAHLRAVTERHLAYALMNSGQFGRVREHAHRSLQQAERVGDGPDLAESLGTVVIADMLLGYGCDEAALARALRLEDPNLEISIEMRPSLIAGDIATYLGRLDRSIEILVPLHDALLELGYEHDLVIASSHLIWAECWRGNLSIAEAYAVEAIDVAVRLGSPALECMATSFGSLPAAWRGDVEVATSRIDRVRELLAETQLGTAMIWVQWAQAVLTLARDDFDSASAALDAMATSVEAEESFEPARAPFVPQAIEARIGQGRLAEAAHLLEALERSSLALGRAWAIAAARRCRAMLMAATGDVAGAVQVASEAVGLAQGLELRLELARALLLLGRLERRHRRRRAAAEALERAAGIFAESGARLWQDRADAELERIGWVRGAPNELTPSEQRIAGLAASGLSNRQVAERLLISPKTVEANLSRAYEKLGIHSRAELGRRFLDPAP